MSQDFYENARQLGKEIPIAYRQKQFKKIEAALHDLIGGAEGQEQAYFGLGMLVDHYHFTREMPLAESNIRKQIELLPEHVDGWVGLVEHFHYHDPDIDCAAKYVEIAFEKAMAKKEMVRQVLGVRIRIAIEQGNYKLVDDCLQALLAYDPPRGAFDVALEDDFASRIPLGKLHSNILDQYREMVKQSRDKHKGS